MDKNARPLLPRDILSRFETAATLRDNLVSSLGRVLLLCLDDEARVSFERIHDAVRTRHVAVYDLLPMVPFLKKRTPRQQLYSMLQMLERTGSRYISEYSTLCIESLSSGRVRMEEISLINMLTGISYGTLNSISEDNSRQIEVPRMFREATHFVLNALRNGSLQLDFHAIAMLLLNSPSFDMTNPEIPDCIRLVAEYMRKISRPDDRLLEYIGPNQMSSTDQLITIVLERLEIAELPSGTFREMVSILLTNLGKPSYPPRPHWKDDLKSLLSLPNDRYPEIVTVVARYISDNLNETDLTDLDIGSYEDGDQVLLQILSRLRSRPSVSHLEKPLSWMIPFVAQHAWSNAAHDAAIPTTFSEVKEYFKSFDTVCLPEEVRDAKMKLYSLLSENLPWTYAFGHKRSSDNPWEFLTDALVSLRNTPMDRALALAVDNFVYQVQSKMVTSKRSSLYDTGIIFQREDSREVEVDLYTLLLRIPNVMTDENFAPLLNFLSRPNVFTILGYEFNKFAHDNPRTFLLELLKRARSIFFVKTDRRLTSAIKMAQDYLEEPLLANMYTSEDLQLLLKQLPHIESDPRYLPLKLLFRKRELFAYLSPSFYLGQLKSPREHLSLILNTVVLKPVQDELADAIKFAIDNMDEPALPVRHFDRNDFVYLTEQLLSHDELLKDGILRSSIYFNVSDWDIKVDGTPENVLARVLCYPSNHLASDPKLAQLVQDAENILEEETPLNIDALKMGILESMLQYLPDTVYLKPVNLLLKKSNLMLIVPQVNVTMLENIEPREGLKLLLGNLIQSQQVRSEKLTLRRIRIVLRAIDATNRRTVKNSVSAYLVQVLRNPTEPVLKPLLREIRNMVNITVPLEEREEWLKRYLSRIKENGTNDELKTAAKLAFQELIYGGSYDYNWAGNEVRIGKALSLIPSNTVINPLKKLLTVSWTRSLLPADFNAADYVDKENLLKTILANAKRRSDIANNAALMKAISTVETILGGWRNNVEPLREIVKTVKSGIYDPIVKVLLSADLNKMRLYLPVGTNRSSKELLLRLLDRLMSQPAIQGNTEVRKLVDIVRQDVIEFGINIDLLSVLDDVGVPYLSDLAPLRLHLYTNDTGYKYGIVLKDTDRAKRFYTLVRLLQEEQNTSNNAQYMHAMQILESYRVNTDKSDDIVVADLLDILDTIPAHIRSKYRDVESVFTVDVLSHLQSKNEIVLSEKPLLTLLARIADLPGVTNNYTLSNKLAIMRDEIENVTIKPVVTAFHIKQLVQELQHIRQINIDYMDQILNSEVLSYINPPELSDAPDDYAEVLKIIIDYLLPEGSVISDEEMKKHLQSLERALDMILGLKRIVMSGLKSIDVKRMLSLIPKKKIFVPARIFIESGEYMRYVPRNTNWIKFASPQKKLIHLLTILQDGRLGDRLYNSTESLLRYMLDRFNFITETDVANLHRSLIRLQIKQDITPFKMFLNHDNMIKYLPKDFRYTDYENSENALLEVLDRLVRVPVLKRRKSLYDTMTLIIQILREGRPALKNLPELPPKERFSVQDLQFVNVLNVTSTKLKNFLDAENLIKLLPEMFSFRYKPTFKTKAIHLLTQLLKSHTDVHSELEECLRDVENYPDVPIIDKEELQPVIDIIPVQQSFDFNLLRRYIRPTTLIKLLPGTFDITTKHNARVALHDILQFLKHLLTAEHSQQLKDVIDKLIVELSKVSSVIFPEESIIDNNDLVALFNEIPFTKYKQIRAFQFQLGTVNLVSLLPLNFDLNAYKTKKLRLLAVLKIISNRVEFQSHIQSIKFVENVITGMPDVPRINNTDIEQLLSPLPLNPYYVKQFVKNCGADTLASYLPINFDIRNIDTRKRKISTIATYCKMANPQGVSTQQALTNVHSILSKLPNIDVTQGEIAYLISQIPCTHFDSMRPLLRFLSHNDVASLLPWNIDIESPKTIKQTIMVILKGLRDIKELQNDQMFSALDMLEINAKGMLDNIYIDENSVNSLKTVRAFADNNVGPYAKYVLDNVTLTKILPRTIFAQSTALERKAAEILRYSAHSPKVKIDDDVKKAYVLSQEILLSDAKKVTLEYLQRLPYLKDYVLFKLYLLNQSVESFFDPIRQTFRGWYHGSTKMQTRVLLKALWRTEAVLRSKSLSNAIEALAYSLSDGEATDYEIDEAILEIPTSDKYEPLKLYLECVDTRDRIKKINLTRDHTSERLLLDILNMIEKDVLGKDMRDGIYTLKTEVQRAVWDREIRQMFNELPDYNSHARQLETIKSYVMLQGLDKVLGRDYREKYQLPKDRLAALNTSLNNIPSTAVPTELYAGLKYLTEVINGSFRVNHSVARSVDDINIKALYAALPKTTNEKFILGIMRFFSIPNLLRAVQLPKSPFEYVTKGSLLQAVLDSGQEIESVQMDPLQQEALEYFRDRIVMTGPGAEKIELIHFAKNSVMNVDLFGLLTAVNIQSAQEAAAAKLGMFFLTKFDNLIHGVGFDQAAYNTRGTYLKALLEHVINETHVPNDVKELANILIPWVRFDGPGAEPVDLNDDNTTANRIFSNESFTIHGQWPENHDPNEQSSRRFQYNAESHDDLQNNISRSDQSVDNGLQIIANNQGDLHKYIVDEHDTNNIKNSRIVIDKGQPDKGSRVEGLRRVFKNVVIRQHGKIMNLAKTSDVYMRNQNKFLNDIKTVRRNVSGIILTDGNDTKHVSHLDREASNGTVTIRPGIRSSISGLNTVIYHNNQEIGADYENTTFHPDKLLIDENLVLNSFRRSMFTVKPDTGEFISTQEDRSILKKLQRPVQTTDLDSVDLSTEVVPNKQRLLVNLTNRKLVMRLETGTDIDHDEASTVGFLQDTKEVTSLFSNSDDNGSDKATRSKNSVKKDLNSRNVTETLPDI